MSNPKHKEMFGTLVESIATEEVSASNVVHDFIEVKREAAGSRLASSLAAGSSAEKVRVHLDEYVKWEEATALEEDESDIINGMSITELVGDTDEKGLIKVWPISLNDRLDGGLLRGHHMLIFARPEMGKTLMMVNMMAGFVAQDLTVLYVGNEEPVRDTMYRLVSRLTGMNKGEIIGDQELADALARERGYENIYFKDATPGTPRQIQRWIDEVQPDVVIVDQIRNLNVNEEHFVQKLEKAATAVRNLGKSNDVLMVSVTQAGDSASGKATLDMGDVDSSNTGIPAQTDVMVGVGATADDEASNRRILSLPKNKRSGRHEFFPVSIDPQLSNVRSIT
jgi:archaellum biogenesis ATPase FlaH